MCLCCRYFFCLKGVMPPPGMTTRSVLSSLVSRFTFSVRWAEKLSQTIMDLFSLSGLLLQTCWSQLHIIGSSIQPFSWQQTSTPTGKVTLGIVFRRKMSIGGSFPPSPKHARTTVNRVFSLPEVRISTVFCVA